MIDLLIVSSDGVAAMNAARHIELTGGELCRVSATASLLVSADETNKLDTLRHTHWHVVITLDDASRDALVPYPGSPQMLHWAGLDNAEIATRIDALVRFGFLEALTRSHNALMSIVETLSEGVIAHDMNRRIFFFSKGAELLTGLDSGAVLGRDCHTLFEPRLCGEHCTFCVPDGPVHLTRRSSMTVVFDPHGVRKELRVSVVPVMAPDGSYDGAVISLADMTRLADIERRLKERTEYQRIIGQDHKMQQIYDLIGDLAPSDFPVLITGESGTGKELVATAIHSQSRRRDNLFVPINCGALPEGTLESELFGHVKGAFTGAIRDKKGRFELADGGTVFLDEVAELSPQMQVKLLRVLQEGTFEPVGGEKTLTVDVRILSATNKDLRRLMREGLFREDLFYRLAVVPVDLPPLRDRRNDIPLLAQHFLKTVSEKLGRFEMVYDDQALALLMDYEWPGNIRQLQNAIQYSMIKCRGMIVMPEHLPPEILSAIAPGGIGLRLSHSAEHGRVGRRPKLTRESVETVLLRTDGNKAKAARMLGVGRATLYNFLREHPDLESIGGSGR